MVQVYMHSSDIMSMLERMCMAVQDYTIGWVLLMSPNFSDFSELVANC